MISLFSNVHRWMKRVSNTEEDTPIQVENLSKREHAKLMYMRFCERFNDRKNRAYDPRKASLVRFEAIDSNILQLVIRINICTERLNTGVRLTPNNLASGMKTVTLDEFFTDEDGTYIPAEILLSFQKSCRDLFAVLEALEKEKDPSVQYSERLLRKYFLSIINACKAMEDTTK